MTSEIISSVIHKLKSIEWNNLTWDDKEHVWSDLAILGFLTKFFHYARIYRNHLSTESSASLLGIEQAIQEEGQRFLQSPSLLIQKGCLTISDFSSKIHRFKGEIDGLYADFSECLAKSISSLPLGELMEFLESLPKNLVDNQNLGLDPHHYKVSPEAIEPLEEELIFWKKFVRFAMSRGLEQRQLGDFLIYCQVVGGMAALLSCMYWFDKYETFDEDISEVVDAIKPVTPEVRETYIQVLKAIQLSGSSLVLSREVDKEIFGDFVDYVIRNLWEVLVIDGSSFLMSGKYQMQMLYEGLQFLRNILRKQPEKFNGLHAHTKDLVGAVIIDAGILIFSVYMHQMEESSAKELVQQLFSLLDKIEGIKAEVPETYPVKSAFNFPATNELEYMDLLQEKLKELASYKVDSLSSAEEVIQKVQEDIVFLKSCLQNTMEQRNQHEKLQTFWSHVMEVAYEAEFVIDSLMNGDISYSFLKQFNAVEEQIKVVKTEALGIDESKYVLASQKVSKTLSDVPMQRTVSTINEVVVGLKDETREIIDQLRGGSRQLEVVSIVGMPGLGKTTLAQKVYNDSSNIHHFYILAWCCISQVYNRKKLLIDILACVFPKDSNEYSGMSEDNLAQKLYQRLKGKRYLIVLDDVWDIKAWSALEISFPDDSNGSRILLTSRHSDVALKVKRTGKLHPLRRLTDVESSELLRKKLAGKEDYYPALPVLGEKIARNCHGLPLTVVVIGGILSALDPVGWEEVAERLSSVVCGTDDCMNVLELSYRYLPDFLKPCLLYFGAFLEDEEISIQRLMRLWIAEGFVNKNGQKSQEEMAEEYIRTLMSKSLIMVAKRSSTGGVKTCRIHDLLHEFCVAKAKEENFVQLVRGFDELCNFDVPHNLRRMCINTQQKQFVNSRLFGPRIRSLLFLEERGDIDYDCELALVFGLKLLRVLDLEQLYMGFNFPSEITMLIQLRYLAVRGHFKNIPASIVNLSNLETFVVTALAHICFFPDSIWTMQKLRCLRVNDALFTTLAIENFESTIALLSLDTFSSPEFYVLNLDTFSSPEFYLGENMEKVLRKFPNIRKLKCSLIEELNNSIWESKKIVEMGFLSRLHSLRLYLGRVDLAEIEFHFPSNLKKLTLEDFSLSILSTIGKLESLEVLKLIDFRRGGIKIWEMEEGDFPQLKFLKLEKINTERWIGPGEHLPCLEKLILFDCRDLKELPSCLGCISTLESIEVRCCPESVASLVQDIKEELVAVGIEDLKVVIQEHEEGFERVVLKDEEEDNED